MKIMMVILLTFCLPLVASAEMKQLVCKATYVPAVEDKSESAYAKKIRNRCAGEKFSETYEITLDTSFLESKQSFGVELKYTSCESPRPYDNGIQKLTISSEELKVFHFGTTSIHINRNTLEWYTYSAGLDFRNHSDNNLPCEIKDVNTSQRKI